MRERTLSELLGDVALYADVPAFTTSTRPTKAQATRLINESIYDFGHEHKAFGTRFNTTTIAVSSGTTTYALPGDFAALRYLRFTEGGERRKIYRGTIDDMDREGTYSRGWSDSKALYMLLGISSGAPQIMFTDPKASYTVTVGYIPELTVEDSGGTSLSDLSADTDRLFEQGGICTWVALDAAIKIKEIDQEDASDLRQRRLEIEGRLKAHLEDRDVDEPMHVRNTWGSGRSQWP